MSSKPNRCFAEPIEERKRRLADVVASLTDPQLQNTDGIEGEGRALFEAVKARGMEGVVAKRLGNAYAPGKRAGAWLKVKVPGYAPDRREWFESSASRTAV